MNKLLTFLDNTILKIGVIVTSLVVILYPKLPSIHVTYTWVYIRLEDFFILGLTLLWLIQVIRKKARLALPLGIPILLYWLIGFLSVSYSIFFIGPHLAGFFPKIAFLEYLRRIEYMILFFIGFSAIKERKDLKQFVVFFLCGIAAIVSYGIAQHFYPYFWKYLPQFIQKTNFCFPSYQTGNEEFAKGIPLCLPVGSRVTSTFGGHYDLAGYLIIVLPIIFGFFIFAKKKVQKILLSLLFLTSLIILILTSSRSAFIAYLLAMTVTLFLLAKKRFILPVFLVSLLFLVLFSESTIHRFVQTFRITSVVVNMQGQIIGFDEATLPQSVQTQLKNNKKVIQPTKIVQGTVPEGSSFITIPQARVTTNTAVVQQGISTQGAEKLKLANGGLQLSTIKGNFSVQKALVYDISVTTRLQGEWPNAIAAFLHYPLLGKGYSTLTLAVDNDFLRLLGESGTLGFLSFFGVMIVLGIYAKQLLVSVDDPLVRAFSIGLIGGIVGLFFNATLFDIFEASKVAESLWILLGIAAGSLLLYKKHPIHYFKPLLTIVTSTPFLYAYLVTIAVGSFWSNITNFFVGDDFIWLKWAATSSFQSIPHYFTNADGFFYRPLDKVFMLLFYSVFAFQPQGYHVVILLLYALMAIGVYALIFLVMKKKLWAFSGAVLLLLLPVHTENIFWISSLSIDLSAVCMIFTLTMYLKSRLYSSWLSPIRYIFAVLLGLLALLSYELAVVMPLLLIAAEIFIVKKHTWRALFLAIPFVFLDALYVIARNFSHAVNAGGDYGYTIPHVIPNIVGNTLGYMGVFLFGEFSLPFYTSLRTNAKQFSLGITLLVIVLVVGGAFVLKKLHTVKFVKNNPILLFAIAFICIALLPYLGLGNIDTRYGYFASVGFVLLCIWSVQVICSRLPKKAALILGVVLVILVIRSSFVGFSKGLFEWKIATNSTYTILGAFKVSYPSFPPHSKIIIVNRPIRYGNAWIFPTGFPEGLWFVYGDMAPEVIYAPTKEAALHMFVGQENVYRFLFTGNTDIEKIQ